jgi:hypothetical protein
MITGREILIALGFFFGFLILCAALGTLVAIIEDLFGGSEDD